MTSEFTCLYFTALIIAILFATHQAGFFIAKCKWYLVSCIDEACCASRSEQISKVFRNGVENVGAFTMFLLFINITNTTGAFTVFVAQLIFVLIPAYTLISLAFIFFRHTSTQSQ